MTSHAPLDVQMIGHTVFTPPLGDDGDPLFLPDENNIWTELTDSSNPARTYDGQALIEFAGRLCYQSYHRPNPATATNDTYLLNILRQKHGSVLEHASVSFYLAGVSRTLTHELVRHRHFSFSELSQRFVDISDARIVIPPLAHEILDRLITDGRGLHNPNNGFRYTLTEALNDLARSMSASAVEEYGEVIDELKDRAEDAGIPTPTRKQLRETARASMINATESKMVVTGNYRAWIEFLIKRDNPAADAEIRRLAQKIGAQLARFAPHVFGPEARAEWDESMRNREMTVTE